MTAVDCCWSVVFCGSGWHFVCRVVLILYFLFYFFHSFRFDVIHSWKDSFSFSFFMYLLLIFIHFFISPFTCVSFNSSIHSYTNIVLSINHFFTFYLTIFFYVSTNFPLLSFHYCFYSFINFALFTHFKNQFHYIYSSFYQAPPLLEALPVPRLQPPPATRRKISAH